MSVTIPHQESDQFTTIIAYKKKKLNFKVNLPNLIKQPLKKMSDWLSVIGLIVFSPCFGAYPNDGLWYYFILIRCSCLLWGWGRAEQHRLQPPSFSLFSVTGQSVFVRDIPADHMCPVTFHPSTCDRRRSSTIINPYRTIMDRRDISNFALLVHFPPGTLDRPSPLRSRRMSHI